MQVGEDCYYFMNGEGCRNGSECMFRHCEAARDNRNRSVCSFWLRNACAKESCHFTHPSRPKQPFKQPPAVTSAATPCVYFAAGNCKNGASCKFLHASAIRAKPKPCLYYASGECQNGEACPFLHIEEPKPKQAEQKKQKKRKVISLKDRSVKTVNNTENEQTKRISAPPRQPRGKRKKITREKLMAAPQSAPVSFGVKTLAEISKKDAPPTEENDDDEELSI